MDKKMKLNMMIAHSISGYGNLTTFNEFEVFNICWPQKDII